MEFGGIGRDAERLAISLLDSPSASRAITSCSRGVSASIPVSVSLPR
jgi:hypothetical protein